MTMGFHHAFCIPFCQPPSETSADRSFPSRIAAGTSSEEPRVELNTSYIDGIVRKEIRVSIETVVAIHI
jgi:hypothetical protein